MTKLRMIPDGEKFSASDTMIEPGVWLSRYSFRRTSGGPRYEKTTRWSFRKCTQEEREQLAMYDLRVWAQGRLRDAGEAAIDNPDMFAEVDVKAHRIDAARQPVDPVQRFIRAGVALGMSEAEAAEFAKAQVAKAAQAKAAAEATNGGAEADEVEAE